jgi:methylmalonyl-CoA mutase
MAKALEKGIPKLRIEEAAARKQAGIDSGDVTIVGVNKYKLDKEDPIDILDIDNTAVREGQIARLKEIRTNRDSDALNSALIALSEAAKIEDVTSKDDPDAHNLLALAINAARARATVGEISDALEAVWGRHRASTQTVSGVYENMYSKKDEYGAVKTAVEEFAKSNGRRPRILVVKMGQDGHDRGAKVVATAFADMGFDVDMGPLFSTPAEVAKQAIENDAHIIGVSSLAAGHKTLIPDLINELKVHGADDIMVIAGGVIPVQDYDFLRESGVAAIFGPGTNITKAALEIIRKLG